MLSFANISVTEPLPVRLEGDHVLSTACGQLYNLKVNRTYFLDIISNGKTSLFMVTSPRIMYINTHSCGTYGAIIVKGFTLNLRAFRNYFWEMETHHKTNYGNLSTFLFFLSLNYVS